MKVIDARLHEVETGFDPAGNRIWVEDQLDRRTTFELDDLNRQVRTVFADGTWTEQVYSDLGRVVGKRDQAGVWTEFEFDLLGRLELVRDAEGGETGYGFDEVGNRVSQTDPNLHDTVWAHDDLGRVVEHCLPLGQCESFLFDENGNVTQHTTFNGDVIVKVFDDNNRLETKTVGAEVTSYTYTLTGMKDTVTDARGLTDNTYDLRDRLVRVDNPDGSWLAYGWDNAGNRTSVEHAGGIVVYGFDELNRLETVTAGADVTTYTYLPTGQQQTVTLPNGVVTTNSFDLLGRLTGIEHRRADATLVASYAYTLGDAGNRTAVLEQPSGRAVLWGYDDLYRLVSEDITDAVAGNKRVDYTYDAFGNRETKLDSVEGLTTYQVDDNDRLVSEDVAGQVFTYAWDDGGRMTGKTGPGVSLTQTWSPEDRLLGFTDGTNAVSMVYDAEGLRVRKVVNGAGVNYALDKQRRWAQVLRETGDGGEEVASYVHGQDLLSQHRLASGSSFYLTDGQLSTRALVDGAGAVTDEYTFDAFGEELAVSGGTDNVFRYSGEAWDAEMSSVYLRARHYRPGVGRFASKDEFQGSDTRPSTINGYSYAENNAVGGVDPSGHFTIALTTAIAASMTLDDAYRVKQLEMWSDWAEGGGLRLEGIGCSEGEKPNRQQRVWVWWQFPRMLFKDFRVTDQMNGQYNCVAWTVGITYRHIWDELLVVPPVTYRNPITYELDRFYAQWGLSPTSNTDVAEVVLYGWGDEVEHAAKAYRCGGRRLWESKLGMQSPRIIHRLEDIEGKPGYGLPIRYYR